MRLLRRLPGSPALRPHDRRRGRRRATRDDPKRSARRRWEILLASSVGVGALATGAIVFVDEAAAPSDQQQLAAYISAHAQRLDVPDTTEGATAAATPAPDAAAPGDDATAATGAEVALPDLSRDAYGATPGLKTLATSGTNYDWAKMVLLDGGWPMTDQNVTVMTRWMRQENGPQDWWNRNNPLNMGAGGFASFPDLITNAAAVAKLLHSNPGMSGIVAALAAGNDTARTEQAIWASNWAGGHYGNGSHWHYTPVDVVKAPASAW
jgi:hypothetical protein